MNSGILTSLRHKRRAEHDTPVAVQLLQSLTGELVVKYYVCHIVCLVCYLVLSGAKIYLLSLTCKHFGRKNKKNLPICYKMYFSRQPFSHIMFWNGAYRHYDVWKVPLIRQMLPSVNCVKFGSPIEAKYGRLFCQSLFRWKYPQNRTCLQVFVWQFVAKAQ